MDDKDMKFFRKFEANHFVLAGNDRKNPAAKSLEDQGLVEMNHERSFGWVATLTDAGMELHMEMNP